MLQPVLSLAVLLFFAQIEHPAIPNGSIPCQTVVKFSPKAGVDDLLQVFSVLARGDAIICGFCMAQNRLLTNLTFLQRNHFSA